MTTIYHWPLRPIGQLFRAGRGAADGGMSLSGARNVTPEAGGGLAVLDLQFNAIGREALPRQASGLMSLVGAGAIFRIPLVPSAQLLLATELGLSSTYDWTGRPWGNNKPWSNGKNWAGALVAVATTAADVGATTITIDMGSLPNVLGFGHVIGHVKPSTPSAHLVTGDVSYAGSIATVPIAPPLRNAMRVGDLVTFRPKMLGTIADPDGFAGLFVPGRIVRPGTVQFIEALP